MNKNGELKYRMVNSMRSMYKCTITMESGKKYYKTSTDFVQ